MKTFALEPPDAVSPPLVTAVGELTHYLREILHARPSDSGGRTGYRFVFGTRETGFEFLNILENLTDAPLGPDGFRILADERQCTFCAETHKGLLNAVYYFIERVLRVRWVEPGPIGERPPVRRVEDWWPLDVEEVPALAIRGMHITENTQWYREEDVVSHVEWMARNRMNRLIVYSNYSYERLKPVLVEQCRRFGITLEVEIISHNQFLPRALFAKHPEYFPEIDGKRTGRSFVQRCASNKAACALFAANAIEWVRAHPEADVVSLMSNDGRGYCECEGCRQMKPNEQWSRFLCPTLDAWKREFPERRFSSRVYCYRYDPLPDDARHRRGTGVMFDTFIRCRWHEIGSAACPGETRNPEAHDTSKGKSPNVYLFNVLKEWHAIGSGPLYVFDNIAQHGILSLPVANPEILTRDLGTFHAMGLAGMIVQGHVHSFGSYILNFNLFARKSWDMDASYRGIWPELCVRYFGGYGVRVLDFIERLRQVKDREGYCFGLFEKMTPDDWRDLDRLLGEAPGHDRDVFASRYRRIRQSFLYMQSLNVLRESGINLRKARKAGDRAGALWAAKSALKAFDATWDALDRNFDSGMFDTFDIKAKMLVRSINADALIAKYDWFPRPFWYGDDDARRPIFWDYLCEMEAEGLSIREIFDRLALEFTRARDGLMSIEGRLEEILDDVEFR